MIDMDDGIKAHHGCQLLSYFSDLYQRGAFVDMEFCCGDGIVMAHRFVLAAFSDIVSSLILESSDLSTNASVISLQVEDCSVGTIQTLLDFIYMGQCSETVAVDILEKVLTVTQSLNMNSTSDFFQGKLNKATAVEGGSKKEGNTTSAEAEVPEGNQTEFDAETSLIEAAVVSLDNADDTQAGEILIQTPKTLSSVCCALCDEVLETDEPGGHLCKMNPQCVIFAATSDKTEVISASSGNQSQQESNTNSVSAVSVQSTNTGQIAEMETGMTEIAAIQEQPEDEDATMVATPAQSEFKVDTCAGYTRLRVYQAAASDTDLDDHIKIEVVGSSGGKRFKCPACKYSTNKQRYLTDHTRKVHPHLPTLCPICKTYVPRHVLHQHKKTCGAVSSSGSGDLAESVPCTEDDCDAEVEGDEADTKHYTNKHTINKQQCDMCGKIFTNSQLLMRHMTTAHNEGPLYKCEVCEYTGANRYNLINHMRGIHGMELDGKPYKRKWRCTKCDFAALYKSTLEMHMRKHLPVKPFKCKLCSYATDRKDSLAKHLNGYHKMREPHKCCHCNKQFSSDTGWRRHCLKEHSDIRPYKCEECSEGFVEMRAYRQHMASRHAGGKTFQCDHCNFTTNKSKSLKLHLAKSHQIAMETNPGLGRKGITMGTTHYKFRFRELSDSKYLYGDNQDPIDDNEETTTQCSDPAKKQSHDVDEHGAAEEQVKSESVDQKELEASEVLARIGEMVEVGMDGGSDDNIAVG